MQWWCSLFWQWSHFSKLSPSTISSRQIGHVSSSSRTLLKLYRSSQTGRAHVILFINTPEIMPYMFEIMPYLFEIMSYMSEIIPYMSEIMPYMSEIIPYITSKQIWHESSSFRTLLKLYHTSEIIPYISEIIPCMSEIMPYMSEIIPYMSEITNISNRQIGHVSSSSRTLLKLYHTCQIDRAHVILFTNTPEIIPYMSDRQ